MRILLADDDQVQDHLLAAVFRKRGWATVTAVDGMQTMKEAHRMPPPDLILLDIAMPAGSGLVTLRNLSKSSRTSGIPVLVLSGSEDPGMPKVVADLGAMAFLKKPVDPETLALSIEGFFQDGEYRAPYEGR